MVLIPLVLPFPVAPSPLPTSRFLSLPLPSSVSLEITSSLFAPRPSCSLSLARSFRSVACRAAGASGLANVGRLVPGLVEAGAEASPCSLCFRRALGPRSPDQDAVICGSHHYCAPTVSDAELCASDLPSLVLRKQLEESVIAPVTGELYRMRKLRVWDWNPKSVYSNPHPQPILRL